MKIPTELEQAMDDIELDISDCDEIDQMTDDHLEEFYKWAKDNYTDYYDVDGISGVLMLQNWQHMKAEQHQDAVDGRGDHLCHLQREG